MDDINAIFTTISGDTFELGNTLLILAVALGLGFMISLVYICTHRREGYTASFAVTLIMITPIIAITILLIGNNIARAFSLAGAFTLIRFRSAVGNPKDIAYVFFTLAAGLACGMGYIAYAVLFAGILCLVTVLLHRLKYAVPKNEPIMLKINIPEDMNFEGAFDDIFSKYLDSWSVSQIKTSEYGMLFKLSYRVKLKDGGSKKDFIDELRARNGNLDISVSMCETEEAVIL